MQCNAMPCNSATQYYIIIIMLRHRRRRRPAVRSYIRCRRQSSQSTVSDLWVLVRAMQCNAMQCNYIVIIHAFIHLFCATVAVRSLPPSIAVDRRPSLRIDRSID